MAGRFGSWRWQWNLPPGRDSLELDFTGVDFMEPWALTMFTCYGMTLATRHKIPLRIRLDDRQPSNKYFKQMGLLDDVATGKSTMEWDDSNQNTGLHVLRTHEDVTRFMKSVTVLGKVPSMRATLDALQYGMVELGRNVIQHAKSDLGGVALAQYYPDSRRVQVAVCDAGVGVRQSLARTYPEATCSDLAALKLALLPHVSGALPEGTYAGNENAGLGLFFSKEICWRTGGSFWILSNGALIGVVENDESGERRVYRPSNERWPGTVVVMDVPEDGVTEAGFESILEGCRELAAKASPALIWPSVHEPMTRAVSRQSAVPPRQPGSSGRVHSRFEAATWIRSSLNRSKRRHEEGCRWRPAGDSYSKSYPIPPSRPSVQPAAGASRLRIGASSVWRPQENTDKRRSMLGRVRLTRRGPAERRSSRTWNCGSRG